IAKLQNALMPAQSVPPLTTGLRPQTMRGMNRSLYIIDGHAQIYRSYYAVMGLRSPSGEPTNATFGFVGMLLKLFQMRKPTHLVPAMDAGTSGREVMAASYNAQRKPIPEDMPPQIECILQIVDTIG